MFCFFQQISPAQTRSCDPVVFGKSSLTDQSSLLHLAKLKTPNKQKDHGCSFREDVYTSLLMRDCPQLKYRRLIKLRGVLVFGVALNTVEFQECRKAGQEGLEHLSRLEVLIKDVLKSMVFGAWREYNLGQL